MHVQGSSINQAQLSGSDQLKQAIGDNAKETRSNIYTTGLNQTAFENRQKFDSIPQTPTNSPSRTTSMVLPSNSQDPNTLRRTKSMDLSSNSQTQLPTFLQNPQLTPVSTTPTPQSAQPTASKSSTPPPPNNISQTQRSSVSNFLNKAAGYFTKGVGHVLKPPLFVLGVIGGAVIAMASPPDTKSNFASLEKFKDRMIPADTMGLGSDSKIEFALNVGLTLAGLLPSLANKMLNPTKPQTSKNEEVVQTSPQDRIAKERKGFASGTTVRFQGYPEKKRIPFYEAFGYEGSKSDDIAIQDNMYEKIKDLSPEKMVALEKQLELLNDTTYRTKDLPEIDQKNKAKIEQNVKNIKSLLEPPAQENVRPEGTSEAQAPKETRETSTQLEETATIDQQIASLNQPTTDSGVKAASKTILEKFEVMDENKRKAFDTAFSIKTENMKDDEIKGQIQQKIQHLNKEDISLIFFRLDNIKVFSSEHHAEEINGIQTILNKN